MQNTTKDSAARIISNELTDVVADKILLLISGGSSAQVAIEALKKLPINILNKIDILLADERYVDYDSPSSNAKLLKILGINKITNNFHELLDQTKQSRDFYGNKFNTMLKEFSNKANYIIAVLGVGEDGHTAGILPNSEASVSTNEYGVDYSTEHFERITISPKFFKKIDYAFVYAQGVKKESILDKLVSKDSNLPMELIKSCKNYKILFNEEEK